MSLLEKVRNFFYDDEYEEDIEPEKPQHKEKKEKFKIKEHKEAPKEKQEISERELFKAERTFNFPMDLEDEEENIPTRKQAIEEKETDEEEVRVYKPKIEEVKKEEVSYTGIRDYAKYEEKKEERNEPKKFKPTPVISPIYGILDKNYKKEDVLMDVNQEHESPKKVDYDTVRKRAYADIYTKPEETKGIFYNLEEEKEEPEDTGYDDDNEDVKIIYNDVTYDDEEKNDEDMTIGEKIEAYEKEKEDIDIDSVYEDDDQILSETKEQDLFNLIDNMYNSEEEEEEEED